MTPGTRRGRRGPETGSWPALLVTLAAGGGSAWWAYLSLRRADGLATAAFDQAYFQQLVWSVANGSGLRSSFNPGDFLGLHFSPILVLPAALQALWPDARLLSLLQVAALGLAVAAAFLFLRAVLHPSRLAGWVAAALTVPLIVSPIYQQQLRADFHPEALALPLVLLAGWAGLTRRPVVLYVAALIALTAKEDQVYSVAVMGLLVAARGAGSWRHGARRHGLALVAMAAGWAVAVFGVVKPALRAGVTYDTDGYYAWLGQGLDIARVPFEQTDALIEALTRPAGWLVVGWLIVSMGGLALVRPRWLLLVGPPLVAHLLSRQIPQQQVALQYGLLLVVPALVASGLGARRLLAHVAGRQRRRRCRFRSAPARPLRRAPHRLARRVPAGLALTLALALVPAMGLGAAIAAGSVPPFSSVQARFWDRPAAIDRVRAIAASVPHDAPLATDWGMASALAGRPRILVLSALTDDAYVLLDADPWVSGSVPWATRTALIADLPTSGRTRLIDDGRFSLWSPRGG